MATPESGERIGRAPTRRPPPNRRWGVSTGAAALLIGLLLLAPLPGLAGGSVIVQFRLSESSASNAPSAPFTSVGTTAGAGGCLSTQATTLPFGAGSARSSIQVTEPHGCANRHLLTFLPSTRLTNGLSAPAGHTFDARLDLVSLTGTTALIRTVNLYLQQVGAGNPIVTGTHILVRNGAVVTTSTSVATLAALTTYGIGLSMRLNLQATASTVNLIVLLVVYVDDGGIVRSLDQQQIRLALTY